MKRGLILTGVTASVLLLFSCSAKPIELPSSEVMKRALIANSSLQSVDMSGSAVIALGDQTRITANLQGTIVDGGLTLLLSATGSASTSDGQQPVSVSGALTFPGTGEVYFRIDQLVMPQAEQLLSECFDDPATALNRWWKTGSFKRIAAQRQAPDAALLQSQLQTLRVDTNLGMIQMDGGYVYHYGVSIDSQRLNTLADVDADAQLLAGTGELWIDAKTFQLRRATWSIANLQAPGGGVATVNLDLSLGHYGHGGRLLMPSSEAAVVSPDSVFATFFSGSLLP